MNLSEIQYLVDRVRRRLDRVNSQVVLGRNSTGVGPFEEITYANLASYLTLSGGLGSGTVTSVGISMPVSTFVVSGSPVTSSGTLTVGLASQNANMFLAGPVSGASAVAAWRYLVLDDLPAGTWTSLNDGVSSGLHADILDDHHGAHYLDRYNHTGVQPFSSIDPLTLPTTAAGHGITDAATDAELASHASTTSGVHGITSTGASIVASASFSAARSTIGAAASATTISTQHSLTGGGDLSSNRTLNLVGDTAAPGVSKYYGTDATGTRGWYGSIDAWTKSESDGRFAFTGHTHSGVYESAFSKGDIVQGSGVTLSGTLTGRLVGSGNVTVNADVITDHGALGGLADDDHTQYLNNSRGDARYLQLGGGTVTGSLALSNLGADLSSGAGYKVLMRADSGYGVRGITLSALKGYIDVQISDVPGLQTSLDAKALATRSVGTQHSLTGGGDLSANRTLSLVNDTLSPGASKYYGTDGSGVRGWYNLPSGGGSAWAITVKTGAYTATSSDNTIICTFSSDAAITLPTSGLSNGQVITIIRTGGSGNVEIYHGASLATTLNTAGAVRMYVWCSANSEFYLISSISGT